MEDSEMRLDGRKTILTGAAGGIGVETAKALAKEGAVVALLGRNRAVLDKLSNDINSAGGCSLVVEADLLDADQRDAAVDQALKELGGVDLLINNAGQQSFRPFAEEDPAVIERIVRLNTITPMLITRRLLPQMVEQDHGRIVNIGSTFGSIAFAWFAAYSASKFGLRGFTEALRRELADTNVGVTYIAPRAVKTKLNSSAVYQMAQEVKMNMDDPEWVAAKIVAGIVSGKKDIYLGFPESMFVRINALFPRLVDKALFKQNLKMSPFARGEYQ
jgi:short-subunit dehydrogenase